MYRLNPLNRNVLITSDEVIAKAPVQGDVDTRNLQSSIVVAEERFIRPALGDKMYEDFCTMKNIVVTSGNKEALQTKVNETNSGTTQILITGSIINSIDEVTNTWYKKLWQSFLWQLCAECVAYSAITTNAVRSTAQGEMNNNPAGPMGNTGPSSVNLSTLKFKMDRIMSDRIDPLLSAMKSYLCINKAQADFSLWDKNGCDDCSPAHKKQTGYVYGVYDDINRKCGCD